MKDKIKAITKNSIVQNLSILVLGTILAQVIVIGFQLVLRRLYSPSDFGAFAVYMSILGILSSVSSLRYVQTIILPKQKTDGIKLFKISIFLTFIFSAILCLLIIFFLDNIVLWFNFPKNYSQWLFVIPLSVFMFSFSNAGNYFLIREKQFRISASNKIVRRIGEGTTQTFFALASKSAGLFIGDLIGQLFISLRIVLKHKKIFSYKFSIKEYLEIAKKYKHFPIKIHYQHCLTHLAYCYPLLF